MTESTVCAKSETSANTLEDTRTTLVNESSDPHGLCAETTFEEILTKSESSDKHGQAPDKKSDAEEPADLETEPCIRSKENSNDNPGQAGEAHKQKHDVNTDSTQSKTEEQSTEKSENATFPYVAPSWVAAPTGKYELEVIKNGVSIDVIDLSELSCLRVGRVRGCDLIAEHPTISRFHAVLQFCAGKPSDPLKRGFYLYDMESTHGTFCNKHILPVRKYIPVRVGHVIKFGASTRLYILQGPEEDMEPESELSVAEIKAKAAERKFKAEAEKQKYEDLRKLAMQGRHVDADDKQSSDGSKNTITDDASWGLSSSEPGKPAGSGDRDKSGSSSESEEDKEGFYHAGLELSMANDTEAFYRKDPKKALKAFFDRECLEPEYEFVEKESSFSHAWTCRIELPVEDEKGAPLVVEATVSGSKKDATAQLALDACRLLDAKGLLREGLKRWKKRKRQNLAANDFYESDEDEFLDRTGDLKKKRDIRKKRAGVLEEKAETFSSLVEKLNSVNAEIISVKRDLAKAELAAKNRLSVASEVQLQKSVDTLDEFMLHLRDERAKADHELEADAKRKHRELKARLERLQAEADRLTKLAEVAKPHGMPSLLAAGDTSNEWISKKRKMLLHAVQDYKQKKLKSTPESSMEPQNPTSSKSEISPTEQPKAEIPAPISNPFDNTCKPSDDIPNRLEDPSDRLNTAKAMEVSEYNSPDSVEQTMAPVVESDLAGEPKNQPKQRTAKVRPPNSKNEDLTYQEWIPPSDQAGDGKTHLNEKYGY